MEPTGESAAPPTPPALGRYIVWVLCALFSRRGVTLLFRACIKHRRPGHTPLAAGASGMIATVAHDAIMTPMDVMKQRLQLGYYKGMGDCFRQASHPMRACLVLCV